MDATGNTTLNYITITTTIQTAQLDARTLQTGTLTDMMMQKTATTEQK